MSYIDGFLLAVPTAKRDAYRDQAEAAFPIFHGAGATRLLEGWGDDVPDGKTNDLKGAVQLKDDETVVFSWIEYPDKAARDAGNEAIMNDPAMADMEMPFDGQRMIFAGFEPIVEEGAAGKPGYVDGFLAPVRPEKKDAYRDMAVKAAAVFREYGAIRVVEAWGENIADGKVTDFNRAVLKEGDEKVVFSWIEWPSKDVRDEAWKKVMEDERMKPSGDMPFDGKRMIWGGFVPIVDRQGGK